ncbi:methyl-accepting chemotaxis protein [Anaerosporobacter sp.]
MGSNSQDSNALNHDKNTIRGKIYRNNKGLISIMLIIVGLTSLSLLLIFMYQSKQLKFSQLQSTANEIVTKEQNLITSLANDIISNTPTNNEINNCTAEKTIKSISYHLNSSAKTSINKATALHTQIHTLASEALTLSQTNPTEASNLITSQVRPLLNDFSSYLHMLSDYYGNQLITNIIIIRTLTIFAFFLNIILAIGAIIFSQKVSNRTAESLIKPINMFVYWSEQLSQGVDSVSFTKDHMENELIEVDMMVHAFQRLANNIQHNVDVVKRVADGDLTAYVEIHSSTDSLGKNLYHMVQSNDIMFAEISRIANTVSNEAQGISDASNSLAESCSVQATTVIAFKNAIGETYELIQASSAKIKEATAISNKIKDETIDSSTKMAELLAAMEDIQTASENISAIIRTIEDIAAQTNLLSLNASIEAARAGDAGRGFAVVANHVSELAAKSVEAASETKKMIEDTIKKTNIGNKISVEAANSFKTIAESIDHIVMATSEIATAGNIQTEHITTITADINQISESVESNAAASEETAAASEELMNSATLLKDAMGRFILREREPGKPYIPKEKRDDPEFIRQAEANYQKAVAKGKVKL